MNDGILIFIGAVCFTIMIFSVWYGASISCTLEAILRELRKK